MLGWSVGVVLCILPSIAHNVLKALRRMAQWPGLPVPPDAVGNAHSHQVARSDLHLPMAILSALQRPQHLLIPQSL